MGGERGPSGTQIFPGALLRLVPPAAHKTGPIDDAVGAVKKIFK